MPVYALIGALFATTALVLYLVGTSSLVIRNRISSRALHVLTFAVCCDVIATLSFIMQAGTPLPRGWHGWIGYSALALMIVNLYLIRTYAKDTHALTPKRYMRVLSGCAMVWWIIAYITGVMFSM